MTSEVILTSEGTNGAYSGDTTIVNTVPILNEAIEETVMSYLNAKKNPDENDILLKRIYYHSPETITEESLMFIAQERIGDALQVMTGVPVDEIPESIQTSIVNEESVAVLQTQENTAIDVNGLLEKGVEDMFTNLARDKQEIILRFEERKRYINPKLSDEEGTAYKARLVRDMKDNKFNFEEETQRLDEEYKNDKEKASLSYQLKEFVNQLDDSNKARLKEEIGVIRAKGLDLQTTSTEILIFLKTEMESWKKRQRYVPPKDPNLPRLLSDEELLEGTPVDPTVLTLDEIRRIESSDYLSNVPGMDRAIKARDKVLARQLLIEHDFRVRVKPLIDKYPILKSDQYIQRKIRNDDYEEVSEAIDELRATKSVVIALARGQGLDEVEIQLINDKAKELRKTMNSRVLADRALIAWLQKELSKRDDSKSKQSEIASKPTRISGEIVDVRRAIFDGDKIGNTYEYNPQDRLRIVKNLEFVLKDRPDLVDRDDVSSAILEGNYTKIFEIYEAEIMKASAPIRIEGYAQAISAPVENETVSAEAEKIASQRSFLVHNTTFLQNALSSERNGINDNDKKNYIGAVVGLLMGGLGITKIEDLNYLEGIADKYSYILHSKSTLDNHLIFILASLSSTKLYDKVGSKSLKSFVQSLNAKKKIQNVVQIPPSFAQAA